MATTDAGAAPTLPTPAEAVAPVKRGYERVFVKGAGDVPALKQEMLKAKESYGKDFVTISSAKKADPRFPWPLSVTRIIERPAEYGEWDVEELHLTLGVDRAKPQGGGGAGFVLVPFAQLRNHGGLLPPALVEIISAGVQHKWESLLRKRDATPRRNAKSWALERVFDWADTQYGKFLRLLPDLVESYLGTSARGNSQRRYLLRAVEEVAAVVEVSEEELEERRQQAIRNFIASQTRRIEKELAAQREKERAGQLRRAEIEASGEVQFKQPSQKEQAAALKAKKDAKGSRLAKRAPKASKPMTPEEKAKMEKEKAKREAEAKAKKAAEKAANAK